MTARDEDATSESALRQKRKIAILGGGVSGLAAALELTGYHGWQDLYEVTIYQVGHRLGGKCATGRGPHGRIEEHGIHILQGWYDNCFRLMREVYEERKRYGLARESPYQKFEDALAPDNSTIMTEYSVAEGRWSHHVYNFPPNDDAAGERRSLSPWENLLKLVSLGADLLLGMISGGVETLPDRLRRRVLPRAQTERLLRALTAIASRRGSDVEATRLLRVLLRMVRAVIKPLFAERLPAGAVLRKQLTLLEMFLVVCDGLLSDVYDEATRTFDFDKLSPLDFREWLARNGASRHVLRSATVRFLYTGTFASLGDDNRSGRIDAGLALRVMLLAAGYKGGFVFKFRAGTGDTMVMPIYEVLKHRGVQFKFFHKVGRIVPGVGGFIDAVTVAEQVALKVPEYDPAVFVGEIRAWPAEPRYEQIVDEQVARLHAGSVDLESPWAIWDDFANHTLKRGRDFDDLVLAIPIEALKTICAEVILRDARWQAMVQHVRTVQTWSVQLWLEPTLRKLGFFPETWGLPRDAQPQTVVYATPLYAWADMTRVLKHEAWDPGHCPGSLFYFCGVAENGETLPAPPSDHGFPKRERERLLRATEEWLRRNAHYFWPNAVRQEPPWGFDLDLLFDPEGHVRHGIARLDTQVIRANPEPSARYTLALPGTAKYRLRTDESGYENLYLAGDWINFGLNVGHIEGAIVSGVQAAQAARSRLGCTGHRELYADMPHTRRTSELRTHPRLAARR
jgi:uncharacterized protein with NAD-binding domain and iron-sulfur cluster